MKTTFLFLLCFTYTLICPAQSYSINHFQSSYDTLVTYRSLTLEARAATGDFEYWDMELDFGFEFPFFDQKHREIVIVNYGIAYFSPGVPRSRNNVYLFDGLYIVAPFTDTSYLYSEVRYDYVTSNKVKALVVEFHNVYNRDEYYRYGPTHKVNLQMWFYENGVIEVHFGDIDLANCSHYFPGQGFSFSNTNPSNNIHSPWVFIQDTTNKSACISGDHSNPSILYDNRNNCEGLTSVPPEGYIIQFMPLNTSSIEELIPQKHFSLVHQNGMIKVAGELMHYQSCSVYNLNGSKIAYTEDKEFSVSLQNPQVVLVAIDSKFGREFHKLLIK